MIPYSSTTWDMTCNKGSSARSSLQPGEKMSLWICEYYDSLWGLAGVDIHCHKCTWSNDSIKTCIHKQYIVVKNIGNWLTFKQKKIQFKGKRVKLLSISAFLPESNHIWMRADGNHYKSELEILEKHQRNQKRCGKQSSASRISEYKTCF